MRSGYSMAALASAADPTIRPVAVRMLESGGGFDVAVVIDDDNRPWTVRAPSSASADTMLKTESQLLEQFAKRSETGLPFAVPKPAGYATVADGDWQAIVHPDLGGHPLHPGDLRPGRGLARHVGESIAAIHELPRHLIEDAGLPVYEADEYRERRLTELDRAAATSIVPLTLLTRWEKALEDVGRWRFTCCLTHGDLVSEHVLVDDDAVVGVLGWAEAKVADPADDLAWLAVGADEDALDSVLEAYAVHRVGEPDPNLPFRARLAGELALIRWLLYGVAQDDDDVVDDAEKMLQALARSLVS